MSSLDAWLRSLGGREAEPKPEEWPPDERQIVFEMCTALRDGRAERGDARWNPRSERQLEELALERLARRRGVSVDGQE